MNIRWLSFYCLAGSLAGFSSGCLSPASPPSTPLELRCSLERVLPDLVPQVIEYTSNDTVLSVNTVMCVRVAVALTLQNTSPADVTFCALDDHPSYQWQAAQSLDFTQDPMSEAEILGMGSGSAGPIGAVTHRSLFRSLKPGAVLGLDIHEIQVPATSTSLTVLASCWFTRDGHEIGMNAWTGKVLAPAVTFPLNLTNAWPQAHERRRRP